MAEGRPYLGRILEEWIGNRWHQFITRRADRGFPAAAVALETEKKTIGVLFRALGGEPGVRVEAASAQEVFIRRSWLQRLAGSAQSAVIAWQDGDALYLPPVLQVFPQQSLNRDLYLWLAILAARSPRQYHNWALDNQRLVTEALAQFPALRPRYRRLVEALLPLRPVAESLPEDEAALEMAIRRALLDPHVAVELPRANRAPQPVPLWLYPQAALDNPLAVTGETHEDGDCSTGSTTSLTERKRGERAEERERRDGLMLFRLESLFSWSEYVNLERSEDDTEDEDAAAAAEDMEKIVLSRQRNRRSSSIRLSLDLPSADYDDLPLGEGIRLPEWDWHRGRLLQDHVCLQAYYPRNGDPAPLPQRLRRGAALLRSQFEQLRTQRCWLRAQLQGEEIDLKAWADFCASRLAGHTPEPGVYQSFRATHRDMATLMLADLSMSTDAALDEHNRVVDVVRDGLLLCAEALASVGDRFAIYGFSSVRRQQVRFTLFKNFAEPHGDAVRGRLLAMRPGFYTRMGAAVRQATRILCEQPQQKKLLLILSDGKPNDIDHYEGRYGIEDTHAALSEARRAGLHPFCITIDRTAEEYLPYLFGQNGFTVLNHPAHLPLRLPELYHQLTR
ncbi:nitric oxide reductase NorD protein [Microbulbifer donghaiensis]|uniref:Nitric oxide reductase NorD protein n=1 Tax=Microbulbifer donghaiensis TaxID=494016 RepID=A0A1M5E076_9GAMM|nr:nitric oxide reductase NorD protein [Microbulbifer donghaiensis]